MVFVEEWSSQKCGLCRGVVSVERWPLLRCGLYEVDFIEGEFSGILC
jgi:hypothetical protein